MPSEIYTTAAQMNNCRFTLSYGYLLQALILLFCILTFNLIQSEIQPVFCAQNIFIMQVFKQVIFKVHVSDSKQGTSAGCYSTYGAWNAL